jgi:hypothetical protein
VDAAYSRLKYGFLKGKRLNVGTEFPATDLIELLSDRSMLHPQMHESEVTLSGMWK